LTHGDFEEILVSDSRGLYGFCRRYEGQEIQVFFNVGSSEQLIQAPHDAYDLLNESPVAAGSIRLGPKSAAVLRHRL